MLPAPSWSMCSAPAAEPTPSAQLGQTRDCARVFQGWPRCRAPPRVEALGTAPALRCCAWADTVQQQDSVPARQRRRSVCRCAAAAEASAPVTTAAAGALKAQRNGAVQTGPVVLVDNYDSFTYNLSQYLGDLGCDHVVVRNDERTVAQLRELDPRGILVGPGPGRPEDSGIALQVIAELGTELPIFGVCMGHQCIGQVFGGRVVRAPCGVMHGKTSLIHHSGVGLMQGLTNPFEAARYHSLVIDRKGFPNDALEVTAWTDDGTIMAVRHRQFPHIQGVQFHPESIITDNGRQIVQNFIDSL